MSGDQRPSQIRAVEFGAGNENEMILARWVLDQIGILETKARAVLGAKMKTLVTTVDFIPLGQATKLIDTID